MLNCSVHITINLTVLQYFEHNAAKKGGGGGGVTQTLTL